ncbi:hypothetical protein AVEN_68097-1 [Araneus ventricosus]|uniref:Uncharacterized protein n=1 Tax=Araneus ventricosus TaxID=182803 RepID=A0A4Y2IYN4_ARAVE|nr:hypothetical protein AVEN_68097-1 [Araneus ventricosus]
MHNRFSHLTTQLNTECVLLREYKRKTRGKLPTGSELRFDQFSKICLRVVTRLNVIVFWITRQPLHAPATMTFRLFKQCSGQPGSGRDIKRRSLAISRSDQRPEEIILAWG